MVESVNTDLVGISDVLFFSSFVVYFLAFLLYVAQYATFSATRVRERERVLVDPAGADVTTTGGAGSDGSGDARSGAAAEDAGRARLNRKFARTAMMMTGLGFALQVAALAARGIATSRAPWGNMFEFIMLTCVLGVAAGIVMLRTERARLMWTFVLPPVLLLMFVAGAHLYANAAPVVPALKSAWLVIHVSIISLGSGIFLVSGAASIMYLLRSREREGAESEGFLGRLARPLPSLDALDQFAYRAAVVAFPVFGVGIICGAIWAEAAWGRFWGWDPKETVSFITWIIYAAYLHARATTGWKGTVAAWINVAGFATMIFNLFAINLVVSGLHSYAGLN